jgi:hypothetical protein
VVTTNGRINAPTGTFDRVGTDNPRVYEEILSLNLGSASPVSSIDLTFAFGAAHTDTHTAIFGVSAATSAGGPLIAVPLTPDSYTADMVVEAPEPASSALLAFSGVALLVRRRFLQRACARRR